MHRLTTSLLGLGLFAAACGAPAQLDESIYPGPDDTGYSDAEGTGSTGTPLGGGGASGQAPSASAGAPNNGNTGAPPAGNGAGGSGGAASASPPAGGNGTSPAAGGTAPAGGGGTTPPAGGAAGGCPDDITVLFDRPLAEGGCNGSGCHVAVGGTVPDLVSPNPASRLVDVASSCNGRPYIGADDSFLADKISGERPECGSPMPFLSADLLSDEDRQCILDWIDEVSGG